MESEGVYPLPEAQRDRFLLKVDVPYPRGNEEFEILRRMSVDPPEARPILDPDLVRALQRQAGDVFVHNLVAEYIVRLVLATRTPAEFNLPDLTSVIQIGCSPRATLGLVAASRALALIHGRDYVLPTDVQAVAKDVMAHRLTLGFDAIADNISPGPGRRADRRDGAAAHPGVAGRQRPAAEPAARPAVSGQQHGQQGRARTVSRVAPAAAATARPAGRLPAAHRPPGRAVPAVAGLQARPWLARRLRTDLPSGPPVQFAAPPPRGRGGRLGARHARPGRPSRSTSSRPRRRCAVSS